MTLRVLDLFSGIGGFSLGLERTGGFKTVAFCEIEPFPRRVLAKHWPGVPILGDVAEAEFPDADVICGGFPCQDLSSAGKRAGLSGARSGLYRQLVRAIRVVRPRYAIVENVADLLGLGMGTVLGDLAEAGYDAEWDCIQAAQLGAPHERERVWIVAHPDSQGEHGRALDAEVAEAPEPAADTTGHGCGPRRPWGLADRLPGLSDAPRWNPADADEIRRNGRPRNLAEPDGWAQPANQAGRAVGWQGWPDEPALLGVDDGVSNRMDRVRALGNSLIPQVPELIGRAILAAEAQRQQAAA
jgi:DNA (cytosine-5)-methyltransferase 1